jgi:N-acetylmuramoyl-L-alanine amidase
MSSRLSVVVLDAGHGGDVSLGGSSPNNATAPSGLLERDLVLDLARRVRDHLGGSVRVVLTRDGNHNLSLADRARIASEQGADVFLSLHLNGDRNPRRDETICFVARNASGASRVLARTVADRVSLVTLGHNRGVHLRDLGVLLSERHLPETASALVEIGHLTNPRQARLLEHSGYRDEVARAIAGAIAEALGGEVLAGSLGAPSFNITKSVGEGGSNLGDDVEAVKRRLATLGFNWITADKKMDNETKRVIKLFQSIVHGYDKVDDSQAGVDGLISVPGKTLSWLQAPNAPHWETMPPNSPGLENYELADTSEEYDYGTDWLCAAVVSAAARYKKDYMDSHAGAAPISINDASLPRGQRTTEHSGHQTGLMVDLRLPRTDGKNGGVKPGDAKYDRAAARAQLKALSAEPLFRFILFNDQKLIDEGLCQFSKGHDDHFHFQIKPPTITTTAGLDADSIALDSTSRSPLHEMALKDCWERLEKFKKNATAAGNPNKVSQTRITKETGVKVDDNPYTGITKEELSAVIHAGFHSNQMPEVLLALWAKEGSTRSVTSPEDVPHATTEANAKSLFRSKAYYQQLGTDHFIVTRYDDVAKDNVYDDSDAAAPKHEARFRQRIKELVQARVLSGDIADAINAELKVTKSGGTFQVLPATKFYALSLLLADAFFTKLMANSFPELAVLTVPMNYIQWNVRDFGAFLKSAEAHRKEPAYLAGGSSPTIEEWSLHRIPKSNEWSSPRRNGIRFLHYLESYAPVFEPSIEAIKPGISDLREIRSRTAESVELAGGFCPAYNMAADPATKFPVQSSNADDISRAALRAAGMSVAALTDFEKGKGLIPLIPISTCFGQAAMTELVARLRYSPAQFAAIPHTYASDAEIAKQLGVTRPQLLAARLLLEIPGHFRQLARGVTDENHAHALESIGWLLAAFLRDRIAAIPGQPSWWLPPIPDWAVVFPDNRSSVGPYPAAIEDVIRGAILHSAAKSEGQFRLDRERWRDSLAYTQWKYETGVLSNPAGTGQLFYLDQLIDALPPPGDTGAARAALDQEWKQRVAKAEKDHPKDEAAIARALRECRNGDLAGVRANSQPVMATVNLQGVELATRFPVKAGGPGLIRQLPFSTAIQARVERLFHSLNSLAWNDIVFQTAGSWCYRGKRGNERSISEHSYGLAVDINAVENPRTGKPAPDGCHSTMDPHAVAIFRAFGFTWGRDWRTPDPHHFEIP